MTRLPLTAKTASPDNSRGANAASGSGNARAVVALLFAILCCAPACTAIHTADMTAGMYGRGGSAQDNDERGTSRRDSGGTYESSAARDDASGPASAAKGRAGSDFYGSSEARAGQARGDQKRASADNLYERRARESGKDAGEVISRGRRDSELYGSAGPSGDRLLRPAEKGAEATILYEGRERPKEPGRTEPDQARMIARERGESDLYGISQSALQRTAPKKTEDAKTAVESQPPAETEPVIIAAVPVPAAPPPAKEPEAKKEVPVSEPTAAVTVPPSPARGKDAAIAPPPSTPPPVKKPEAGTEAPVSEPVPAAAVPPPPAAAKGAITAPAPSSSTPEKTEDGKAAIPVPEVAAGTGAPAASEPVKPRPTQGRTLTAPAATQKKTPLYSEQRRETEAILEITTKEKRSDEGILVVNRPPNIQGLTGLLFTNSAYTLPAGKFTVGASLLTEYSSRPEFSVLQIPFTLTYGMTDNLELGIKAKIVDLDSPFYPDRAHGFGDSEISAKWRFASRRFILPDMAVGLSYIAPTGNENKHLNEVVNWGMKFMAIASLEGRTTGGRVMGIYAEAQAVFIDELARHGSSTPGAERYGIINGGVLFPVSLDNRTQLLAEYSQIVYKSEFQPTLIEGNQNAATAAVRYVTEDFSVTTGLQYVNKEKADDQNTYRFVWKLSLTF